MAAWIGVACASHVARGRAGGFIQVCHGKKAPLARIKPGDTMIYYSPTTEMGGGERLQAFTAAGVVRSGGPYLFDMGEGHLMWRQDVDWFPAGFAPIQPLLSHLALTRGRSGWGYVFRFGIVRIEDTDRTVILDAMGVAGARAA